MDTLTMKKRVYLVFISSFLLLLFLDLSIFSQNVQDDDELVLKQKIERKKILPYEPIQVTLILQNKDNNDSVDINIPKDPLRAEFGISYQGKEYKRWRRGPLVQSGTGKKMSLKPGDELIRTVQLFYLDNRTPYFKKIGTYEIKAFWKGKTSQPTEISVVAGKETDRECRKQLISSGLETYLSVDYLTLWEGHHDKNKNRVKKNIRETLHKLFNLSNNCSNSEYKIHIYITLINCLICNNPSEEYLNRFCRFAKPPGNEKFIEDIVEKKFANKVISKIKKSELFKKGDHRLLLPYSILIGPKNPEKGLKIIEKAERNAPKYLKKHIEKYRRFLNR